MCSDLFCAVQIKYKTSHVQTGFQNGFPTSEEHEPKPLYTMRVICVISGTKKVENTKGRRLKET
jgi:hypothetical protein